jgi:hypothetical protein
MVRVLRGGLAHDVALLAMRRDDPEQDEQAVPPSARRWPTLRMRRMPEQS